MSPCQFHYDDNHYTMGTSIDHVYVCYFLYNFISFKKVKILLMLTLSKNLTNYLHVERPVV